MSIYFKKGKGWRVDFMLHGERYTRAWFPSKTKAKQAMTRLRKELSQSASTQTDMGFKALVNLKLDHVASHNSARYYTDFLYMAKRWIAQLGALDCSEISREMIEQFVTTRKKVSARTANKEIRYLRSVFNFGKKKHDLGTNPTDGINFFPVDKRIKYTPTPGDVQLVILHARADDWLMARYPDAPDYLETLRDTLGRMSEINQLTWRAVNLEERYLTLYTRKIDGGLTPRKIHLTKRLYEILSRMERNGPWVFTNPRTGKPYDDRKAIMRRLCKKAEIPYFRFHARRHAGASVMDNSNVPIGEIQKVLGHRNRRTTEIYLHPSGQGSREAINALEAASEVASEAAKETHLGPDSHIDSHTSP